MTLVIDKLKMDVISSVIHDISQSIKGHVFELVPANRIADMNAALAAFVLRAEIYNPDNAYDIHQSFSRANVATLIKVFFNIISLASNVSKKSIPKVPPKWKL